MRFLCLHGVATNADHVNEPVKFPLLTGPIQIFEAQTAAIREQLGDNHTYDFPEGEYEIPAPEEISAIYPPPYLSWHPPHTIDSHITQGLLDIREYISDNGPYDACLGFSQGAVMLASLLLDLSLTAPFTPPPFQLAVFLSGSLYERDAERVRKGARIGIPTAHVWGGRRDFMYEGAMGLRDACVREEGRWEVEHAEGHVVPRRREVVVGVAAVIGKCVSRAIYKS